MKKSIVLLLFLMITLLTLGGCAKKEKAEPKEEVVEEQQEETAIQPTAEPVEETVEVTVEESEAEGKEESNEELEPGMYVKGDLMLSWSELLDCGAVSVTEGMVSTKFFENEEGIGNDSTKFMHGKVVLDKGVTSIAYSGFRYCDKLEEIVLPEGLFAIDRYAFQNCTMLKELSLPKSLESFGHFCVEECPSLKRIDVNENNETYCSIDGVLFSKDQTILEQFPTGADISEYAIPDGVTSITSGAFCRCLNLNVINIPTSVTEIGNSVFWGCSNLTTIHYEGTEEEWNTVTKGTEWMEHCNVEISFQ